MTTPIACPYTVANAIRRGDLSPEQVDVAQVASLAAVVSALTVVYGVRVSGPGQNRAVHWYPDAEQAHHAHEGLSSVAAPGVRVEKVTCQRSEIVGADFFHHGPQGVVESEHF